MSNVVTVLQTIRAHFPPGSVEWRARLPFNADLPSRVLVAPALLVRHAVEITARDGLQLTETLEASTTLRYIVDECVEIYQGPSYATDSGTVVRHKCSGVEEELPNATYLRVVCESPHRPSGELLIVNIWRSIASDDEAAVPTRLFSTASPEVRLT